MGCCGKDDDVDPRDEYEVYVKDLKDQLETLDQEIKWRTQEQKDLQREMAEIDPECACCVTPACPTSSTATHPITR